MAMGRQVNPPATSVYVTPQHNYTDVANSIFQLADANGNGQTARVCIKWWTKNQFAVRVYNTSGSPATFSLLWRRKGIN